jgi:hypothetical protein
MYTQTLGPDRNLKKKTPTKIFYGDTKKKFKKNSRLFLTWESLYLLETYYSFSHSAKIKFCTSGECGYGVFRLSGRGDLEIISDPQSTNNYTNLLNGRILPRKNLAVLYQKKSLNEIFTSTHTIFLLHPHYCDFVAVATRWSWLQV